MLPLPNPAGHVSPFQHAELGRGNSRRTVIRQTGIRATVIVGKMTLGEQPLNESMFSLVEPI